MYMLDRRCGVDVVDQQLISINFPVTHCDTAYELLILFDYYQVIRFCVFLVPTSISAINKAVSGLKCAFNLSLLINLNALQKGTKHLKVASCDEFVHKKPYRRARLAECAPEQTEQRGMGNP